MKYLFTILASLVMVTAGAQRKVFNYEIKTIIQDGKNIQIPKDDSYAIIVASGEKGQMMFMMNGNEDVGSGKLTLISKTELRATEYQSDGFRTVFSWDRISPYGLKMPTKVTMDTRFLRSGTVFQCTMVQGNSVHIYKGPVYDISEPAGN